MTALAGLWSFEGADTATPCAAMLRAQSIYGPDGMVQETLRGISTGRALCRRLPEDIHDRGPISGGDGTLLLAADIRLDNRDELAGELGLTAERLGRLCDADVLMAALERWGAGALDRIVGDFAFALFDSRKETLRLARDFTGQRPLHFSNSTGRFAFASMPKGLHALIDVPYEPRVSAAADFLALIPESSGESFFEGVDLVPPGHVMTVAKGGTSLRRYWTPARRRLQLKDHSEYGEALREHLDRAVKSRLRGAGEAIGTHLSGGLDSSVVTASAARLSGEGKIVAFTASPTGQFPAPPDRIADEWPLAAATAAMQTNIEHVRISTTGVSPLDGLDRGFFLYDRPVLNLCNATWTDAINSAAQRRGLRVMLTGQMGNMTISHEGQEALPDLLSRGKLVNLTRLALALNRRGRRWRGLARQTIGPFLPDPLWHSLSRWFGQSRDLHQFSSITRDAVTMYDIEARARTRQWSPSGKPWASGFDMRCWVLQRVDLGNYNKGILGGWGIDYRDPTADRRLVEFCLSVPEEAFILAGEPRALARRAFGDRLPAAVLGEPKKGYQGADWGIGLTSARDQLIAEVISLQSCAPAAALIDLGAMRRAIDTWPTSGWADQQTVQTYRLSLLRGISAGHFLRRATRSNT